MQIDRVLFPVNTLGPGNRVVIWTIGCPHHCENCSNPELWNSDDHRNIEIKNIVEYISQYKDKADGITITGGDPFFQPTELFLLLQELHNLDFNDILVYTGYEYETLKEQCSEILSLLDVLVDGLYIEELNDNKGLRGSSNQKVNILNKEFVDKYKDFECAVRLRQNFIFNGKIVSAGIPNKVNTV